jgi:hypothetical protein
MSSFHSAQKLNAIAMGLYKQNAGGRIGKLGALNQDELEGGFRIKTSHIA